MTAMTLDQIVPLLQLSIGPVIVISGVGLVLLSMTNRYSQVTSRSRSLLDALRNESPGKNHRVREQLRILIRRARMLRLAIAFAATSLLLAAFLVIALFLVTLMHLDAALLIAAVFIACMCCLISGLIVFLIDVNMSVSALMLETDGDNMSDG